MTERISQASIEKLETFVTVDTDPTGLAVSFSFVASGSAPSSFTAGAWHDDGWVNGTAKAVTPTVGFTGSGASVELAVGTWLAFVKVDDDPEEPVRPCGAVEIY